MAAGPPSEAPATGCACARGSAGLAKAAAASGASTASTGRSGALRLCGGDGLVSLSAFSSLSALAARAAALELPRWAAPFLRFRRERGCCQVPAGPLLSVSASICCTS